MSNAHDFVLSNRPRKVIYGPSVAAIGWIPYVGFGNELPGAYSAHKYAKAFRGLFRTGNHPPSPSVFGGSEGFRNFLRTKNYRAALCFEDVRLICNSDGSANDLVFNPCARIGYTRFASGLRAGMLSVSLEWNDRGEGEHGILYEKSQDTIKVRRDLRFRIGRFGNFISKLTIGHYAPYAWIGIQYTIRTNGEFEIIFFGSFIPSQTYYIDWQSQGHYSMINAKPEQITQFIEAYTNKEDAHGAPNAHYNNLF